MNRPGQKGFTLLEVLLATTILALILGVLYSVLVSTLQAEQIVEKELTEANIGPTVMALISQDLRTTFLPDRSGKWFTGRDQSNGAYDLDRLDFIGSQDLIDPKTALQHPFCEMGFQMQPNDEIPGVYVLYRRRSPGVDDEPLKGGALEEIYDRALSLNIEYTDGKDWFREWKSKDKQGKLPRAVKVVFVYNVMVGSEEDVMRPEEYTSSIVVPLPR